MQTYHIYSKCLKSVLRYEFFRLHVKMIWNTGLKYTTSRNNLWEGGTRGREVRGVHPPPPPKRQPPPPPP